MKEIKTQKNLSHEFIKKLAEISAGYLPPQNFEAVLNAFETEIIRHFFTYGSESNLLRIILSAFDKVSFLNNCVKYPHYVEILIGIAVNSNYLTDILVRDPEFFHVISNPSYLNTDLNEDDFSKQVAAVIQSYKSFNAKLNALRSVKRKEILRIGTRDILGESSIKKTTGELSIIARQITSQLFALCYSEILTKYRIEQIEGEYAIAALGKLGGNELNYSSDIDLIIFFDKNRKVADNKEYYEVLVDVIHLFIESATAITGAGFLYRVDLRLRPDGRNSPLCRTLVDYINYYETRGEDWERQMLIKAGFAGGNKQLYDKFSNYITHFIYPSAFAASPTEQIKKMKANIEKNLQDDENIKLAAGGIRDIEFTVQALQLINGAQIKELRTGNTLEAVKLLAENNLLSKEEEQALFSAYIFYRKIEHYLQLMNDTQTHTIPAGGETLEKLSRFLNFKNSSAFKSMVIREKSSVLKIYKSVMGVKNINRKHITDLAVINFENRRRAEKDLLYLSEGKGLLGQRQFDQKSMRAFEKIKPQLIKFLGSIENPDSVLQNFVRVVRQISFPSIWYKEFSDKKLFNSFLNICAFSQKAIDLFAEDKELHEDFLTRKVFEKLTLKRSVNFTVKKLLFFLSVQLNAGLLTHEEISKLMSGFLEQRLKKCAEEYKRFNEISTDYFVAALGSFGSAEMTFSSDVDLIFAVKNINNHQDIQKVFQNFLLNLQKELRPFEVDCRLRPEGKSSILAWDINSYKKYFKQRARIWELQATTKLKFVCGNKSLFNGLTRAINSRIKVESKSSLKHEIMEMRRKLYPVQTSLSGNRINLKKDRGGLADIEYLVQYFILLNRSLYSKTRGKGTVRSIEILINNFAIPGEIKELMDSYKLIKKIILENQAVFNNSSPVLPVDQKKLILLAKQIGFTSKEDLREELLKKMEINYKLFEKYIGS